jgi:hypothetical protein
MDTYPVLITAMAGNAEHQNPRAEPNIGNGPQDRSADAPRPTSLAKADV